MPRANRVFLPGYAWHLTHRCHKREFLLKFAKDRRRWRAWLFEARKRYGLCVLNYMVTSNHIHLLVLDRGRGEIARSMQLIAGRTAQEYNRRKGRKGAYWEDRYHATAVQSGDHLARCVAYIDLNMVRAGIVRHPGEWRDGGYRELQLPPERYAIIDIPALLSLFDLPDPRALQAARDCWIDAALSHGAGIRQPHWSECIAIGERDFADAIKQRLGLVERQPRVLERAGTCMLREPGTPYTPHFNAEKAPLSAENSVLIDDYVF